MQHTVERTNGLVASLRAHEAFATQPDAVLTAIARISTRRHLRRHQIVYAEGDACGSVYLLLCGAVRLVRHEGSPRRRILDIAGPGALFGALALFTGDGYRATAEVIEPSEVLAVSAAPFVRILQHHPVLSWRFASCLLRRLGTQIDRLDALMGRSAEERIAGLVLESCAGNGASPAWSSLPRADIAAFLSVRPETLSRTLGAFKRRGLVVEEDGGLRVPDRAALASLLD